VTMRKSFLWAALHPARVGYSILLTDLTSQILAIKIFAVRVNSMPEERTVSALTWITPPARSLMGLVQMTARTKVRQHYATETKVKTYIWLN
jgi:hypothetical protein